MHLSHSMDVRQTQNLVMTPQLQQAIKLLQMSSIELQDFVHEELEKNPLLEIDHREQATQEIKYEQDKSMQASDRTMQDDSRQRTSDTFDTGLENIYADEARADTYAPTANTMIGVGSGGGSSFESSDIDYENIVSNTITLRDHIISQIGIIPCSPLVEAVTLHLVDYIDDAGYLRIEAEQLIHNLNITEEVLEDAIGILHELEPPGVGARTLAECLEIQLRDKEIYTPPMQMLVQNLDLLGKHEISRLAQLCHVSQDTLLKMVHTLRRLDPKPGARFTHVQMQTLVPDVFVRRNHLGGWSLELNTDSLPKLLINKKYTAYVKNTKEREAKLFLQECQHSASWLLRSLDQRAKTIIKVATEIVRQQDEFFEYGITRLKPMNLKAIAEKIEMHESTVSRVTSNKYISTERGVFELKFFFTAAISSMDGESNYSSEAVRHQIRSLIDDEEANAILSDDKIMELLRLRGVDVARRTVAKYREAMNIPSSVQRRRIKRSVLSV